MIWFEMVANVWVTALPNDSKISQELRHRPMTLINVVTRVMALPNDSHVFGFFEVEYGHLNGYIYIFIYLILFNFI